MWLCQVVSGTSVSILTKQVASFFLQGCGVLGEEGSPHEMPEDRRGLILLCDSPICGALCKPAPNTIVAHANLVVPFLCGLL